MAKLILTENGAPIQEFPVDQSRLTIGRANDNDIPLESRAVSSRHAIVHQTPGCCEIEDLGSTNGTLINGQPVKKLPLADGDIITIATYTFVFQEESPSEAELEKTIVLRPGNREAKGLPSISNIQRRVAAARRALETTDTTTETAPTKLPLARLEVLSGRQAGQSMKLAKTLTTVGRPGNQVAAITRSPDGYTICYVPSAGDSGKPPKVNGKSIGHDAHRLNDNDVIELAGINMGFFCEPN
ncbi:MAG: FHA domain-containing protein [Pseudomonadota bacterium]|nr:FHA domain-containing protein [Pseudomonadota bacterium]